MSYRFKMRPALVTLSLAALTSAAPAAGPASQPTRIRGEIVSAAADSLTVHRGSGDTVMVAFDAKVPIAALKDIGLSDIKPGTFVGTAAKTGTDGTMTATEVLVFPESARGSGEGHYAWDLGPHSTMTNANVDAIVKSADGRHLTLSYKGGTSEITVPPNVPVVTFAPATRADLVPGKKVFIVATPSSPAHFAARRIVVEKDGVAPPM